MKRLLSLLALLTACAGLAQGHYVIIRLNLGAQPAPPTSGVVGQPNLPGAIGGVRPLIPPPPQPGKPALPPPGPEVAAPPVGGVNVIVLVEYSKQYLQDPVTKQVHPNRITIDHAWGRTWLTFDQKVLQVYPLTDQGFKGKQVPRPTVLQVFDTRFKDMVYDKNVSAAKFIDLADWALTNGLEAKLPEILKQAADRNGDNDPAVSKVLAAFDKVGQQSKRELPRDDAYWKATEGLKVARSEHYTLYYDAPVGSAPEVDGRLKKLEQNYRAFFAWFALRGKVLPAPDRRQVALLLDRPVDFREYYMAFAAPGMAADAFYAPRENLAVFSSLPLDQPYELASRHFRELTQNGWDLRGLLDKKTQFPKGKLVDDIAYCQTMALIQKALHEESETASVSHVGTRQLLTATGLLPRTVILPEWIQFGLPSFFETPKFSHDSLTGAFWTTYGAPHWVYHALWRDYEERKALDPAEEALLQVVSDRYFRMARRDPGAQLRARTMAWALTYFLAHRKLDGLLAYCQELGSLPRDLELDDAVYLACFARAFNLAGPGGTIDQPRLAALAKEWYDFIAIAQFPEVSQDAQKALAGLRKK